MELLGGHYSPRNGSLPILQSWRVYVLIDQTRLGQHALVHQDGGIIENPSFTGVVNQWAELTKLTVHGQQSLCNKQEL